MRALNSSWSDDDPSALATILANSKHHLSQVAVLLDDGTWLRCDDAGMFADAPFGPCKLGPNGDMAIYITHEQLTDGSVKELRTVRDPYYGDRVTYIPASKIKRVNYRHMNGTNRRSTAGAVAPELQEALSAPGEQESAPSE
jgi:hypothetical protein